VKTVSSYQQMLETVTASGNGCTMPGPTATYSNICVHATACVHAFWVDLQLESNTDFPHVELDEVHKVKLITHTSQKPLRGSSDLQLHWGCVLRQK